MARPTEEELKAEAFEKRLMEGEEQKRIAAAEEAVNPNSSTLNPQPEALNPQPEALDYKLI